VVHKANEKMMTQAQEVLNHFEQRAQAQGVEKRDSKIVTIGGLSPGEEICKLVQTVQPDYLVVGCSPNPSSIFHR
jgi:nucleotide-binding universal stress UspA family protein